MAKLSFPSVETLVNGFVAVLKRFPLEMLFAVAGTWAAIQTTLPDHEYDDTTWIRLIMCCNLGLVFSLSATTFTASLRTTPLVGWLLRLLVVPAAAGYYFTLPVELLGEDYFRFFLLAAGGHLLVSVAPFWERGNIYSFWYYNKSLFLRFLTAALYSAVLFAGLAVALLAMDELFGLDIPERRYFQLWIVIAALFNTTMFLAGVPERPLQSEEKYPRALQIFTQYVLIPLVSVYVLILLAYELKILVQWDLPRGWVSNLIIAFAVAGVLSLLLVFPVRNTSENKWIVWYGKVFHWILLPLVALLFLAIGTRLADYGFTESRFIVLATGIWLLFTAVYFLFGRRENIKMIPASLIIFIVLTVTLAFPVSLNSQQQRMLSIFDRNQMLKTNETEGIEIGPAPQEIPREDRQELTSIIRYLYETHGRAPFEDYFKTVPQPTPGQRTYAHEFTDSLLAGIGTEAAYSYDRVNEGKNRHFNISVAESIALPADGFDFLLTTPGAVYTRPGETARFQAGEHLIVETFNQDDLSIRLTIDSADSLRFELRPLLSTLVKSYVDRGEYQMTIDVDEASMEAETEKYRARLYLTEISGNGEVGETIDSVYFYHVNLETSYLLEFKD